MDMYLSSTFQNNGYVKKKRNSYQGTDTDLGEGILISMV
jgi:hypothetical protein